MCLSEAALSFTYFNKLPAELRFAIWERVSLHPRIVHLSVKQLAVDRDAYWWRSVRSDKAMEEDESDYGSANGDEIDIKAIRSDMAAQRLLMPDEKYRGTMSRADAKAVLLGPCLEASIARLAGRHYPKPLYGFRSESPTPGVLLACRESFGVGSRIYSRAFGSLGALAQCWFNFGRDTLYLDGLKKDRFQTFPGFTKSLRELFVSDELARVERLAVRRGETTNWMDTRERGSSWVSFFGRLHDLIPSLTELTIVDGHYAHQDRMMTTWERSGEQYVDLKFMKSTFDSEFCWRVNGFRIDAALIRSGIHPNKEPIKARLKGVHEYLDDPRNQSLWQLPKTKIEVITSAADEELLLYEAYLFEKKHNKGCWYANPSDPTDCDYFAGEDVEELDGLF